VTNSVECHLFTELGRVLMGLSPLTVWETHGKLMLPGGKGAFSPYAADQLVWG
jgi:hypothetical protein